MKQAIRERLRKTRGFVFDLDGTLARGDAQNRDLKPEPGAAALLQRLEDRGLPFVVFTNGTVRTAAAYVPKLAAMGFPVHADRILTPSSVAAGVLAGRGVRRVMALGGEGVWQPLAQAGLEVVLSSAADPGPVDAVYVGWFREFTMLDIEAAYRAIEAGASLYSASATPFFSTAAGKAPGTSVVICAALEALTGRKPEIVGKPSRHALEHASRTLGLPTSEIAIVGDDVRLEIAMAHMGGALAIHVRSGVSCDDALAGLPASEQPHLSLGGVGELLDLLEDCWTD